MSAWLLSFGEAMEKSRIATMLDRLFPKEAIVLSLVLLVLSTGYGRKWGRVALDRWKLPLITGMALCALAGYGVLTVRLLVATYEIPTLSEAVSLYHRKKECLALFGRGNTASLEHPCWIKSNSIVSLVPQNRWDLVASVLKGRLAGKRKLELVESNPVAKLGPLEARRLPDRVEIRSAVEVDEVDRQRCFPRPGRAEEVYTYWPISPAYFGKKAILLPDRQLLGARTFYLDVENQFACQALTLRAGNQRFLMMVYSGSLDLTRTSGMN